MSTNGAVLDGVTVRTYPRAQILRNDSLFQEVGADIYHSQEPSISSYVAQRAVPQAIHVVTSRDPRDLHDWWIEFRHPSHTRLGLLRTAAFYENPLTRAAVRNAAKVFVPAKCLAEKVQRKYALASPPEFMPTPITLPTGADGKAERPTICYVGRLDRRKRPDRFLDLVPRFPDIDFVVAGAAQDQRYADELARRYGSADNLRMLGFVDQFASDKLSQLFSSAWMMINTAAREGLPNVFIEAAAHGCAVISPHDPDGFASKFGWHCADENYAAAINALLKGDLWRARGMAGAAYVRETNSADLATERHLAAYRSLLEPERAG
jgi:glycosyltransferase involved in cell wall biosynthesis